MSGSRIPGFYKLDVKERVEKIKALASLNKEDVSFLGAGLSLEKADGMIENVYGMYSLPLGIAVNFQINERDYLVPMATEESSVVAAASNAARVFRSSGGFRASSSEPVMTGQIQVVDCSPEKAASSVIEARDELIELANKQDPVLVGLGGGVRDVKARLVGDMLVVHILVDVRDAMGANAVNSMCEALTPLIEDLSGGRVNFRILSNYALERTARAEASIPLESIGEDLARDIVSGCRFASLDVYRAVTHNKGVMNGVSAVCLATGNDTRAVESGAHAFACQKGTYAPLSEWSIEEGFLKGSVELPVAVGIIGGGTMHPMARLSLKILGVSSARELGEVLASVGLAQNFAALRALASEGIQKGHMRLHARNIAVMVGAVGVEVEQVADLLIGGDEIRVDKAREFLDDLRKND
ncbi:MAG: hydroxymethylglutaryl-CoA reductase, degradative [Candidatus Altiarchaeota archaeon]|nr:hydroxymethylglutaryl-CoA reductase, degradative [Candidatus Altiarchaeota archaeon]